jgi:hypothetical protein
MVEKAKKLNEYVESKKIDQAEVDAIMEFLTDNGFVNDKGKALGYAYWYEFIRAK